MAMTQKDASFDIFDKFNLILNETNFDLRRVRAFFTEDTELHFCLYEAEMKFTWAKLNSVGVLFES